jgi:hypothetical protein
MRVAGVCALAVVTALVGGCRTDGAGSGPPVPASADPEGKDLVVGAVVAATEKAGGVRLYKIKETIYFPPPLSHELVMLAYDETANDFRHASDLWRKGGLNVSLANVRVYRHVFRKRNYRVLANEPVTAADLSAKNAPMPPPKRPKKGPQ